MQVSLLKIKQTKTHIWNCVCVSSFYTDDLYCFHLAFFFLNFFVSRKIENIDTRLARSRHAPRARAPHPLARGHLNVWRVCWLEPDTEVPMADLAPTKDVIATVSSQSNLTSALEPSVNGTVPSKKSKYSFTNPTPLKFLINAHHVIFTRTTSSGSLQ